MIIEPDYAPVFIERMWLADTSFSLEHAPADSMLLRTGISYEKSPLRTDEDGVRHEVLDLEVSARLVNEEDENDVRLSAMAHVQIEVGVDLPNLPDDEAEKYLTKNAISMSYAHARTCILTISSLSPMDGLILPPILPDEVIKTAEKKS